VLSPLQSNFHRSEASLTAPKVLSPPLRGFHRASGAKLSSSLTSTLQRLTSGFATINRYGVALTALKALSPLRSNFHRSAASLTSRFAAINRLLNKHVITLIMKRKFAEILKKFSFSFVSLDKKS
jgi:hypothetical protein